MKGMQESRDRLADTSQTLKASCSLGNWQKLTLGNNAEKEGKLRWIDRPADTLYAPVELKSLVIRAVKGQK